MGKGLGTGPYPIMGGGPQPGTLGRNFRDIEPAKGEVINPVVGVGDKGTQPVRRIPTGLEGIGMGQPSGFGLGNGKLTGLAKNFPV